MNPIDSICLVLIVVFAVRGAVRGLIREVFGLLAIIGAFILAYLFAPTVAKAIIVYSSLESGADILAYSILFVSSLLIINYLGRLLTKVAKGLSLSFINRLFGALVGSLKVLTAFVAVWYVLSLIQHQTNWAIDERITQSFTFDLITELTNLFNHD